MTTLDILALLALLPQKPQASAGDAISALQNRFQTELPPLDSITNHKLDALSFPFSPGPDDAYLHQLFNPTSALLTKRLNTITSIREEILSWFASLTARLPARDDGTSDVTEGFALLESQRALEDETADELVALNVAKDQRWGSNHSILAWTNNQASYAQQIEAWMETSKREAEIKRASEQVERAKAFMHRMELAWGDCIDEEAGFFNQLVTAVRTCVLDVLPTNPLPPDVLLLGEHGGEYGRGLDRLYDVLSEAYQTLSNSKGVWEHYLRYTHSFKSHLASSENALDLALCATDDWNGQNVVRERGMAQVTAMANARDTEIAALDRKWQLDVERGILPTICAIKGCIQGRAMASGAAAMSGTGGAGGSWGMLGMGAGPTLSMYSNALTGMHTTRMNVVENIAGSGQVWGTWDPVRGWK